MKSLDLIWTPYSVEYGIIEAAVCAIYLTFENVPTKKIGDIYNKFKGTSDRHHLLRSVQKRR